MSTVLILKRYVFKKDIAFYVSQIDSVFLVFDIRFDVKDLSKSLKARITVLELLSEINDYPDRFGKRVDIQKERNEIRDLNITVRDKYSACDDDNDIYQKDKSGHA